MPFFIVKTPVGRERSIADLIWTTADELGIFIGNIWTPEGIFMGEPYELPKGYIFVQADDLTDIETVIRNLRIPRTFIKVLKKKQEIVWRDEKGRIIRTETLDLTRPLSDYQMYEYLKRAVERLRPPPFRVGDTIIVVKGFFKGLEGRIIETDDDWVKIEFFEPWTYDKKLKISKDSIVHKEAKKK